MPKKYISYSLMKYIRPIWYFHLISNDGESVVWTNYNQLSRDEKEVIHYDQDYSNQVLSNWDASYQALMKGIVKKTGNNIQTDEIELLPADIYRFIRKYHKKIWLYLVFFQRLSSLFNPISEFIGLWQTRHVQKYNLFHAHYVYDEYPDYDSSLIKSNPLLSIIIPTYNRYEPLNNLLKDLEEQTYTNFEVILIDQSNPFQKELYNNLNFRCHIIRQEDPALWKARNRGIKSAKSEYLLFLDDDSRITPDWILEHLKCLDYFQVDISSGVSKSLIGAKIPENYSFFRWSDQLDTGNVLITRKVFEKCGLFDEQFEKMRMGDGEFGVRAYLSGFRNISNSKAYREHLKSSKGGLRNFGYWDAFRSKNIFAAKPVPSVLYFWRKYWGNKTALLSCIFTIPFSLSPYKYKSTFGGSIVSCFLFILFLPIIIFQVSCAWVKSTNMIKKGSMVEKL
jgi:glycosyltransferase involved in cell wall biosynthesis